LERVTQQLANGSRILDDINLVVEPNEFVAILGPSGSGKSTLMNAMTGRRRASGGLLTLNGEDFYANSAKYRQRIGHVPQKDIVHQTLTVEQTLKFAAQLRLPATIPAEEVSRRVADVVQKIGLHERTRTRNSELSGGQLKRVSLGVELLSDPELLFLDEATSGLDAGTEARMMSLFRRLADDGRTVVCITHNLENVCLCDLVAVLVGGRLAYYGATSDLKAYFGVEKVSQIYDCLEARTPEVWVQQYAASAQSQQYVRTRLEPTAGSASPGLPPIPSPCTSSSLAPVGGWRQFLILTVRYVAVTLQDRRNLVLLLAQAPIIALLLGLVFRGKSFDAARAAPDIRKTLSFLMVVSAIWFGCINAAREIVKELPIYLRERAVGLNLGSYLGSKIAVLSLLCAVQCAMLLGITLGLTRFRPDVGLQTTALLLTSFAGMLMGLLVSALVKSEDKAMAIVPILLIPQVIFSGAILELSQVAERIARWLIVAFWSFDAMLHGLPHSDKLTPKPHCGFSEDITTIGIFLVGLTFAAAFALRRKDSLS
jgi:ABC transport system ATP-binding/permease protein